MPAVIEKTRALARIVRVDDVVTHPKADRLDIAIIGGWQCVVKRDEFKKDQLGIYFEIDSLLPLLNPLFSFLEERTSDIKKHNDLTYSRIKSIKLRGEISQGLLLPLPDEFAHLPVETNLTEKLEILKWEVEAQAEQEVREVSKFEKFCAWIAGGYMPTQEMPWPTWMVKSDQERIQNLAATFRKAHEEGWVFEESVKLDGSSMSIYARVTTEPYKEFKEVTGVETGVCSRNCELNKHDVNFTFIQTLRFWLGNLFRLNRRMFRIKRFTIPTWKSGFKAMDNHFVKAFYTNGVKEALENYAKTTGKDIVVQGELCGPGIQKNWEGLDKQTFFVYSVYGTSEGKAYEYSPEFARELCAQLGINYVPVLNTAATLPATIKELLKRAEGKCAFGGKNMREGLVYKCTTSPFSFKVISNNYLLKQETLEAEEQMETV